MEPNGLEREMMEVLEMAFEPLLTAEEAAAYLRIHPKTLQKMARLCQVPSIRIGKYWRFRLSAQSFPIQR